MEIRLETERLILRQFEETDAEELHAICNQEYVLKWMPDWKVTVEELRDVIGWFRKCYSEKDTDKMRMMLAATLKTNGRMIGLVGIGTKEEVGNETEIAFYISEEYCCQGYISEAARAVSEWVLSNHELEFLIAIVETDNYPSQRVVEKCGFKKLGTKMILNTGDSEVKPFFYYRLYKKDVASS